MSDVTNALALPPDPEQKSDLPLGVTVNEDGTINIPLAPVQPAPIMNTADASSNGVPTVSIDASGVPHVTVPLTKKTKANVGTAVGVLTTAGVLATQLLPEGSEVAGWIAVAVGVIGNAAVWLGIYLPTNLPIKLGGKK